MSKYQETKRIVREYFAAMENSTPETVAEVLKSFTSEDYLWRGVYPFREQQGAEATAEVFWAPLMKSMTRMQRRQDIFIGGTNEISGEQWVMSMGHFMGLFDAEFLGLRPTGKIMSVRYAEFNCVENGKITKTGLFVDLLGMMDQAGVTHYHHQQVSILYTLVLVIMMVYCLTMHLRKMVLQHLL